jgi:flagellar biosynthesis protein FlhF
MKGIKMPTITVTAPDSAMAMDEVVRQLGSDAYILSTTQQDGLVQIKASLDPLITAPLRPNIVKTVFEEEMEKQFSVAPPAKGYRLGYVKKAIG